MKTAFVLCLLLLAGYEAQAQNCDASQFAYNPLAPSDAFNQACIDAITATPATSFCAADCQELYNAYLECFGAALTDTFFTACGGFLGDTNPPTTEAPATDPPDTCDATNFVYNPLDPSGSFDQACIDGITADPATSFCVAGCQSLYNAYLVCFGATATDTFFSACGGFEGDTDPDIGGDDDDAAATTTSYITLIAFSATLASVFAKMF